MIVFWHSVKYVDCMKTLLHIVFVVAIGLSAHVAEAQEPQVMSLHDCMEYAISNSTKVRIQEAASGDARLDRRDAALALFTPQISAQTYAYYNFGRSIDPQTNTYFNTTSFHNNYGVSAGYDLFDGFKAVNNYKISKTGMLIADSQEKQVEADICLAVMEAYYNVVYYKRLCDVYEEQVAVAEQALAKAKRQEELGQKGHADVIQMEADLADRQYDLTNTYNMYESQRMTLADLMFWPVDEELVIDTSMPAWQVEPVSTSSVVDFALEHNPAVQIASWKELNAKRELNTAKWQSGTTGASMWKSPFPSLSSTGFPGFRRFPVSAMRCRRLPPSWIRRKGMWRARCAGPSRTATAQRPLTSRRSTRPRCRPRPTT